MIELPEAVVLARQVKETLHGKKIAQVTANHSPHKFAWYTGDPTEYPALLTGKTIRDASSCGNHVEILADDLLLAISTPIKYHVQGAKPPAKHQLYLEFEDGSAMSCTVQMWGAMLCLRGDEEGTTIDYRTSRRKPSPLSDAFDSIYYNSLFDSDTVKLSAKAFLATEQRIPGLGNGVLQDILWTARIHPRRRLDDLSVQERDALYASLKRVLLDMATQGGRDTERDLFNRPGGYRTILSRNTLDQPCSVCGGTILKEAYLGGNIYFCTGCQKL